MYNPSLSLMSWSRSTMSSASPLADDWRAKAAMLRTTDAIAAAAAGRPARASHSSCSV
jgi:hypothetical protein